MFASSDESTFNVIGIALLISVVIAIVVPWYRKLSNKPGYSWWGIQLAVMTTLVYLLYEATIPSKLWMRLDIFIIWPTLLFVWINAMLALRNYENMVIYVESIRHVSDELHFQEKQNPTVQSVERRTLSLAVVISVVSLLNWYAGAGLTIILLFFLVPEMMKALMVKRKRHAFWSKLLALVIALIGLLAGLLIHHDFR